MLLRKKLVEAAPMQHRSTRAESDYVALDFASVRSDMQLLKSINNEEVLFSELCTKTNHQGVRQRRLVILTSEALYIFKKPSAYQKRLALDSIDTLILSMESVQHCVIRLSAAKQSALKTALLSPLELAAQQASVVSNNTLMLDMTRRNAFAKVLRQAKPVKLVRIIEVNHAVMERVFKDPHFTLEQMQDTQRILSNNAAAAAEEDSLGELTAAAPATLPTHQSIRKRVSLVLFSGSSLAAVSEKKRPPEVPTRKPKPDVKALIRRASMQDVGEEKTYYPRCPPCTVALGVVQPIWSLVERALEPLLDLTIPPASGLVRCADILLKLLGEQGPKDEVDAIKAIALLCFDKDAARALLRSLHENLPILGGSALVDSLDALQRCENVSVRTWSIKSLWKLLPMCMSEHAMPITSNKWMTALGPENNEDGGGIDSGYVANEGEAWFIKTYFRGKIKLGVHEKEPLRRIAKRKASFSVLGGNYRQSANFPAGLSPLLVQQAFSQVLLQNMFDVQRRAAFTEKTLKAYSREATSDASVELTEPGNAALQGVTEQDCIVVLELLLNSLRNPTQQHSKPLEVTGKRIANTVLLPTLMGMLVLLEEDTARQRLLKDISLLLLRSETNLKAVLDIPDWQLMFVPLLQTIPRSEEERTAEQRTLYKYVLNLLTMIHTYCFKEPTCRGGPLNSMLRTTNYSLALFGGWNNDTIGVARWIYLGLCTQLAMTARMWWHDAEAPEWTAFAQLVRCIEDFVFFHATMQPLVEEQKLVEAVQQQQQQNKSSMASEDSYGSDDESENVSVRALGKRKKRAFSITPVYELKDFTPVVLPFSPRDAKRFASRFDWMLPSTAEATTTTGEASSALTRKSVRKPLQSQDATPAAQSEKFRHFGLHLAGERGSHPLDLPLVECAVDLLKRMGITGNAPEDARRADLLKQASKKQKSLLRSASEWCQTLQTIHSLLSALQASEEDTAMKNTMDRIAQFVETRYEGGGKQARLGVKQTKAVATKLEASVLKQRQLAKQELQAKTQHVNEAVTVSAPIVIQIAEKEPEKYLVKAPSRSLINKRSMIQQHTGGKRSLVDGRTRFYSSVDVDEDFPPPPPLPKLTIVEKKQTVLMRHGISFDLDDDGEEEGLLPLPPPPPPEQEQLTCEGCKDLVDEFDSVKHSQFCFHSDCFVCEECRSPLLKSDNPEETNLFFESSGLVLKKFCSSDCRMHSLAKHGNAMCPGCMCLFQVGDHAIESCSRLWHVDHLKCQDCDCELGRNGNTYFPVEIEQGVQWPFCSECHERRFKTCAKCNQSILPTDGEEGGAFHALGRVFHQNHFNCFRCGDNFKGKREFFVDGHGDSARALCLKCWNDSSSPRICCDLCNLVLGDSDDCVELGGKIYHASRCFVCHVCKDALREGEVFENPENASPMCDQCFYAKRGVHCDLCTELILENPLETEDGKTFHSHCFACEECNGLALTGRYFLSSAGKPVCERHWQQQNCTTCSKCLLPVNEQSKVTVREGETFHLPCLTCHYCHNPLAGATTTAALQLNVGPDDMYYCDEHAGGVCPHPGCKQPCWADGRLFKVAGQYLCEQHFAKASEKYMEDACARCGLAIKEYEGFEVLEKAFHYDCFACTVCLKLFEDGEDFKTCPGTLDPVHAHCL